MVMAATQTQVTFPVAIPREAARQVRRMVLEPKSLAT